jgi:hypothetical protein
MRAPTANKAVPSACPHCDRPTSEGLCGPVHRGRGWFCWSAGLIEDPVPPTPDPTHVAVTTDPAVLAALVEVRESEAAWDAAEAVWQDAAGRAAEAAIRSNYVLDQHGGVLSATTPRARRKAAAAEAARVAAWEERERAGEALVKARAAHAAATRAARARLSAEQNAAG